LTAAAIGLAALIAASSAVKEPRPKVRVTVTPRIGTAPVTVQLRARVSNEAKSVRCPEWIVRWGDGSESRRASSCPPFQSDDEVPETWSLHGLTHRYRIGGDHEVTVEVKDLEGAWTGRSLVIIEGPEPLGSWREEQR
jgi:hypothetical protein